MERLTENENISFIKTLFLRFITIVEKVLPMSTAPYT